jgi:hypothetical protein
MEINKKYKNFLPEDNWLFKCYSKPLIHAYKNLDINQWFLTRGDLGTQMTFCNVWRHNSWSKLREGIATGTWRAQGRDVTNITTTPHDKE